MITIGAVTGLNPVVRNTGTAYTANQGELVLVSATGGAFTVTLPTAPAPGWTVGVKKTDSTPNTVTVTVFSGSSANLDSATSQVLSAQNSGFTFVFDGSNWQIESTITTAAGTGGSGSSFATMSKWGMD